MTVNISGDTGISQVQSGATVPDLNVDSGTLYVDPANNRVGIGTNSPATPLHTVQSGQSSVALFQNTNASWASDVQVTYSPSGSTVSTLGFSARSDGSTWVTSNTGDMLFITGTSGFGFERMRIDSAGRVIMTNQPYFFARRSTTWTGWVPNSQTQPMLFDNVVINNGNHFNGSTGLFTAPVAGVYQFWSGIYSPGYVQTQHWPVINGNRGTTYVLYGAGTNNLTGTFFIKVNANDTIGFHAYDGASSGQVSATQEHTFFYGHLIG